MGSAEDGRTSGGNPGSACNRRPGTGVKTPVLPTVAPTDCIPNCNALLCCNCGQDSRRHVLIDNTRSLPPMGGGVGPGFPRQKTHSRSQQQQEKERLLQEAGSSRACYKIETGGGVLCRRSAFRYLFQESRVRSRGLRSRAAPAPENPLPPKVPLQIPFYPPYHRYYKANYNK